MKQITFEEFTQSMAPEGLSAGSIFGALSGNAIQFLLQKGRIYEVRAGDTVYEYGDRGDRFYIVCRGVIEFFKYHNDEFHLIRTAGFGQEVGFVAMIDLHEEGGSAIAKEDSLVLQISSELFSDLQKAHPLDFGLMTLNLARDMARVISKLGELLIDQTSVTVKKASGNK